MAAAAIYAVAYINHVYAAAYMGSPKRQEPAVSGFFVGYIPLIPALNRRIISLPPAITI